MCLEYPILSLKDRLSLDPPVTSATKRYALIKRHNSMVGIVHVMLEYAEAKHESVENSTTSSLLTVIQPTKLATHTFAARMGYARSIYRHGSRSSAI